MQRRTATNVWPTPPTTSSLSKAMTIAAGTTFTPAQPYTRFDRGSGACKGQTEGGDADAVFLLQEGATLSRVTIGANQAEGVHCLGSCTLDHVYFEDVCEDAITIKQTSASSVSRINFGGVSARLRLYPSITQMIKVRRLFPTPPLRTNQIMQSFSTTVWLNRNSVQFNRSYTKFLEGAGTVSSAAPTSIA
ncbi:Pectate lyase [Mycena venus]|uniref:Pectate lyase n=1 Tax=Mycena venus TaxID=2733690 RepID=A0A8H6X3M3_9AGAR|nr:Pectate lyase [Mycena venus]